MTLVADGADLLIGEFGEEVTVYPQTSDTPEDSSDPIYFEEGQSQSSFTQKVRLYTTPSEEKLQRYGFDEDTEAVIYERDNAIGEGDEVVYNDNRYVVRRTATNHIGHGDYLWIHDLVGI